MLAITEITVIRRARFFAGALAGYGETLADDLRQNSVINPAEIEYNGIRLFSATPKSAAEAEKINRALDA